MIQNVMYVQELLHNIQYELWDIDSLNPSELVARLQQFNLAGWEQRIVAMLRQAVHQYRNERAILKYIYIADKLTKLAGYHQALTPVLADLYCDVFHFLHLQKCNKQLEELKILRKFWVGTIHPYCLSQMKQNLLHRINVDIDSFKNQTKEKIKKHYEKMGMKEDEIEKQFPKTRTASEDRERFNENKYAIQSTQPSYAYYNVNNNPGPTYPNGAYGYSGSYPAMGAIDPRGTQQSKRKRFASQQTRIASTYPPELPVAEMHPVKPSPRPEPQPQEPTTLNYKAMLSRLNQMNPHVCKECGQRFITADNLEQHKKEHLKERLLVIDKGSGSRGRMVVEEEWVGEQGEEDVNFDQFVIKCQGWPEPTICPFCCQQLHPQLVQDEWVFVNATLVSMHSTPSIMHKKCQWTLEKTSKHT